MTGFDYAFLLLICISLAVGAWRGFVSEVLALLAWAIAFFVARHFGSLLVPLFSRFTSEPLLQQAGAYVSVFIVCLLLLGLLRLLLRELIHAVGLGLADRSLGAIFGVLRGCLIALLLVLAGGLTDLPRKQWWSEATFAPPLEIAVLAARPLLPERVAKRLHYR